MVDLHTWTSLLQAPALLGAPLLDGGGAFPWLSVVTFLPLLGVLALLFMPKAQHQSLRMTAFLVSLVTFGVSLGIMAFFDPSLPLAPGQPFTFQQVEGPTPWVELLGIHYAVGVDGFSLWLVMLTTFLMPLAILSTFSAVDKHVKEYMICLLFLETGMLGALVATDVFLFYIFWEMMLIPMYFIIGIWGSDDRIMAAKKFFIYTLVGSLLMLVAILYIYFQAGASSGTYSFLFTDLVKVKLSATEQKWLFLAFFLAFAIKVPLFPFHTWLPLAHVQAPTAGSVVLAGVMLKMGTYGLVRYAFPLFPDAVRLYAPLIAALSVIGILYGAIVAMVQPDVKKIVAYSSVSHLGFCVLGLVAMTPSALAGGVYIMLAHGIATGGLFLCVGILYERRHTKKIKEFGGIAKVMPVFSTMFMIIVFASVGLPGLNGFVGEFLTLIGTSQSRFLFAFDSPIFSQRTPVTGGSIWWPAKLDVAKLTTTGTGDLGGPELTALMFAAFATLGVIFAAGYLLWMWRRVMFGPVTNPKNANLEDLNGREIGYLLPFVIMAIIMGVFPNFFISRMEPSIFQFLTYMDQNVSQRGTVKVSRPQVKAAPSGPLVKLQEKGASQTKAAPKVADEAPRG